MKNDNGNVVTAKGWEKLKAELQELKDIRRPEVIGRIKTAKELGDLSENAEYSTAKEEQSFIEGRIQELEQIVKKARIVSGSPDRKIIQAGAVVGVNVEGEKLSFELVGSAESDPAEGKISIDSPVGQALLGHKANDIVRVETPDGRVEYKILAVA
ncbi:MAG: transcription elongation factor GreA [Patescibacteria group bacterium]